MSVGAKLLKKPGPSGCSVRNPKLAGNRITIRQNWRREEYAHSMQSNKTDYHCWYLAQGQQRFSYSTGCHLFSTAPFRFVECNW